MHDDYGPSRLGVVATGPSLSLFGGLQEGVGLAKVGLLLFDRIAVANVGRLANLDTGDRSIPEAGALDIDDVLRRLALRGELGSDEALRGMLTGPSSLQALDGTSLPVSELLGAKADDSDLNAVLRNYRTLIEAGVLDPEPLVARKPLGEPIPVPDELPMLDHLVGLPGASAELVERQLNEVMGRFEESLLNRTPP